MWSLIAHSTGIERAPVLGVASHVIEIVSRFAIRVGAQVWFRGGRPYAVRIRQFAAISHTHCSFQAGKTLISVNPNMSDIALRICAGINDAAALYH